MKNIVILCGSLVVLGLLSGCSARKTYGYQDVVQSGKLIYRAPDYDSMMKSPEKYEFQTASAVAEPMKGDTTPDKDMDARQNCIEKARDLAGRDIMNRVFADVAEATREIEGPRYNAKEFYLKITSAFPHRIPKDVEIYQVERTDKFACSYTGALEKDTVLTDLGQIYSNDVMVIVKKRLAQKK